MLRRVWGHDNPEIRIKIFKNMKGENFGSYRHLGENFRVTSWEFLFEFWRFIFPQSICPIYRPKYSESTICHHMDACPIFPDIQKDSRVERSGGGPTIPTIDNIERSSVNLEFHI